MAPRELVLRASRPRTRAQTGGDGERLALALAGVVAESAELDACRLMLWRRREEMPLYTCCSVRPGLPGLANRLSRRSLRWLPRLASAAAALRARSTALDSSSAHASCENSSAICRAVLPACACSARGQAGRQAGQRPAAGVAHPVPGQLVRLVVQQRANCVLLAVGGCDHEWAPPMLWGSREIGPPSPAARRGPQAEAYNVLDVDFGLVVEQHLHRPRAPVARGVHYGRPPALGGTSRGHWARCDAAGSESAAVRIH